jgi:CSLREA domain-containing protein
MSARSIRRSRARDIERRRRVARRASLATGAAIGASVLLAPGAQAAPFQVNTLNDAVSDGTCDVTDCTLRDAVDAANADAASDNVTFAPGLIGETTLASTIQITNDISIQGPGPSVVSVSGDSNDNNNHDTGIDSRIFTIPPPGVSPPFRQVSISGLTLKEGVAGPSTYAAGGAVLAQGTALSLANVVVTDNVAPGSGGGIAETSGTFTLSNSQVTGNQARDGGGGVSAASYQDGGIEISDTTFTDNRAGLETPPDPYGFPRGGALSINGGGTIDGVTITDNIASETFGTDPPEGTAGGIVASGNGDSLSITDSVISGNQSGRAAGGVNMSAAVTLARSTVSGNQSGHGGGIYLEGGSVRNSTVSGNTAKVGGGVYFDGSNNASVRSSTISGNQATGTGPYEGLGGGVFTYGDSKYGSGEAELFRVRSSTVSANSAAVAVNDPIVELQGTIVADGTAPGTGGDLAESSSGSIAAGFSLIESPGGVTVVGDPGGSNILGVDPKLGGLAANGGPTMTRALDPTSPAIDASQALGQTTDQRGQPRTVDAAATNAPLSDGTDIGAYELQDASATGDDDVTAPDTSFTKKPKKKLRAKGRSKTAKATFAFTGTDDSPGPLTFECKVDGGNFKPCVSPVKVKLGVGKHTFEVRAVDAAGNVDASPAKAKVKVKRPKKK